VRSGMRSHLFWLRVTGPGDTSAPA